MRVSEDKILAFGRPSQDAGKEELTLDEIINACSCALIPHPVMVILDVSLDLSNDGT